MAEDADIPRSLSSRYTSLPSFSRADGGVHFTAGLRHILSSDLSHIRSAETDFEGAAADVAFAHIPRPRSVRASVDAVVGSLASPSNPTQHVSGHVMITYCTVEEASVVFEVTVRL